MLQKESATRPRILASSVSAGPSGSKGEGGDEDEGEDGGEEDEAEEAGTEGGGDFGGFTFLEFVGGDWEAGGVMMSFGSSSGEAEVCACGDVCGEVNSDRAGRVPLRTASKRMSNRSYARGAQVRAQRWTKIRAVLHMTCSRNRGKGYP
jgi:hypothetical protein